MQATSEGTALVTGAGRGIGLACASALAQAGYPLLVCDVNGDDLAAAAMELRGGSAKVDTVVGDLGTRESLDAIGTKLADGAGLAACVHAAGISGTMIAATPVAGRQGTPEEIASVAAFLCSPAASFVCGTDILVDGGSTRQVLRGL